MLLPSSAIYSACEWRLRDVLAEAARDRLTPEEDTMLEPADNDRIIARGLEEALACRDMLAPAPAPPSWWDRLLAMLAAATDAFVRHDPAAERWLSAATPRIRDRRGIRRWPFPAGRAWR